MKAYQKELEKLLHEVISGFPLYGLPTLDVIGGGLLLIMLLTAYSVAGKGRGSHAGREEIRRSYRRKLAQEMAKEDAEKIKAGVKKRRRWMQW